MDEESNQLLRQLIDAQKEQTELLRKHVLPLWTRIRFSLLGLLILMTLVAVGVGITAFAIRPQNSTVPLPRQTARSLQLTPPPISPIDDEDPFGEPIATDNPFAE